MGNAMRMNFVLLLVALLIAAFAIGTTLPVQADCRTCEDCTTEAPAKSEVPCSAKGLACQVAQSCGSQVQKLPAQTAIHAAEDAGSVDFSYASSIAVKSAFITPETAPPRL